MRLYNYTYQIRWCPEEQHFIVSVLELPGVCNDGATADEAIQNVQPDIELALILMMDMGRAIPPEVK